MALRFKSIVRAHKSLARSAATGAAALLLLAACGGSSSSSDNDADEGDQETLAAISEENALGLAQEGTQTVSSTSDAQEAMDGASTTLGEITADDGGSTTTGVSTDPTSTVDCPAGGSVTFSSVSGNDGEVTVIYSANSCYYTQTEWFDGEMRFTSGSWDEYPNGGMEMIMAAGPGGFRSGSCEFSGGMGYRFYSSVPSPGPAGDYLAIVEYGATSSGFEFSCTSGEQYALAPDTSVRTATSYTMDGQGTITASSSEVSVGGAFEAPDGSGRVRITSQGLEFATDDQGNTLYGEETCPVGGSLSLEGRDGKRVDVYFGDDAPDPYEVQVIGPNGTTYEYQSCDEFLQADPPVED